MASLCAREWPSPVTTKSRAVEKGNGTLKDSLIAWMRDNKTASWSVGLSFIQRGINSTYHEEVVFGQKARVGLPTNIPEDFLKQISGIYEEGPFVSCP